MYYLLCLCLLQPCFAQDGASAPMAFDVYWMVFLKAGPQRGGTDDAVAAVQRGHLKHLSTLKDAGDILVAGPFEAAAEEPLRGIAVYRGDLTEAEVRSLAEADPAVKAGRLVVDILRWWTPKGVMTFPGRPH